MRTTLSIATLAFVAVQAHGQLVLPYAGADPSAYISSFQITKSGTAGRANTLYISNASNTSDVLLVNTVGLGRAGYFTTTNAANVQMALRADSNGGGYSFFGLMTGTGKAGLFRIINPANADNALQAQTTGSGAAFRSVAGTGLAGDFVGNVAISGQVNAGSFVGNGSGLTAVNAALLGGLSSSAFLQSIPNPLSLTGANNSHIIRGANASTTSGASGVLGVATDPTAPTIGVRGESDSTAGTGVAGYAFAPSGFTIGGYFQSDSTRGTAVYGNATNGSGYETRGGFFQSASTTGQGVKGYASALSGTTVGGYFQSDSTGGVGAVGNASAESGLTVGGSFGSASTAGVGVRGDAYAPSGTNYGVYGQSASPVNGYGVYSNGRTGASGTKSFRIDHPFNPENEYLLHYSAESPEPQNFYNGVVVTNANGEAWVQLPDYFGEINKDFKYQLTVVEDTDSDQFVMAKIARTIRENKFKIRTSEPNVRVCWRVDAVRNDLWVRKYGAPVEKMKQGVEKGKYQHPELYGKPKEMGMFYRPEIENPRTHPPIKPNTNSRSKRK